MPMNPDVAHDLAARLSAVRPVTARRMFGGVGYYHDDTFFAVADDDRLYFKIDGQTEPDFVAKGMPPWILGDKPQPYREVPPDVLADEEALGEWIDAATAAARRRKAGKRPR